MENILNMKNIYFKQLTGHLHTNSILSFTLSHHIIVVLQFVFRYTAYPLT